MKKKPELLVTAKNLEQVERNISAGADAVSIGHEKYALRVPGNFELEDIEQAVSYAHQNHKKVYVALNALLHNDTLQDLPNYIAELDKIGVDALIFGDPAVYMTVKEKGFNIPLHWNTETTSTNYETIRFWANKGINRAIIARELSLDSALEIKKNVEVEIQAQIHGMTCIFQSKRQLVSNYFDYTGEENKKAEENISRYIKEKHKPETHYPIFEDVNGTHIMSNDDMCMIEHLIPFVHAEMDSLKIEGMFKSTDYLEQIVRIYREAIDTCYVDEETYRQKIPMWLEVIKEIQPTHRTLDTGFYFKEQIY